MTNDLRYPIGKFQLPENINADALTAYVQRINAAPQNLRDAVDGLSEAQLDTPYRPEGWTVRQVVHHIPDSHLSGYIRFNWALTEENPTIKAYDEQSWAALPYQQEVPHEVSMQLLESLHARWVVLLESLDEKQWNKTFVHPEDGQTYSLKVAVALYAWHGDHHIAHISSLRKKMGW